MTFDEFLYFVPDECEYETIYIDNENRLILVVNMLDAYSMVNKLVKAEREACAKVCEDAPEPDGADLAECIRARGQA